MERECKDRLFNKRFKIQAKEPILNIQKLGKMFVCVSNDFHNSFSIRVYIVFWSININNMRNSIHFEKREKYSKMIVQSIVSKVFFLKDFLFHFCKNIIRGLSLL